MRETTNPARELPVSVAHRTVDQGELIRRDSCSPLNPRPDSPIQHHVQGSHTSANPATDATAGSKTTLAYEPVQ